MYHLFIEELYVIQIARVKTWIYKKDFPYIFGNSPSNVCKNGWTLIIIRIYVCRIPLYINTQERNQKLGLFIPRHFSTSVTRFSWMIEANVDMQKVWTVRINCDSHLCSFPKHLNFPAYQNPQAYIQAGFLHALPHVGRPISLASKRHLNLTIKGGEISRPTHIWYAELKVFGGASVRIAVDSQFQPFAYQRKFIWWQQQLLKSCPVWRSPYSNRLATDIEIVTQTTNINK